MPHLFRHPDTVLAQLMLSGCAQQGQDQAGSSRAVGHSAVHVFSTSLVAVAAALQTHLSLTLMSALPFSISILTCTVRNLGNHLKHACCRLKLASSTLLIHGLLQIQCSTAQRTSLYENGGVNPSAT